ncbi:hypothetical protein Nepgr_027854 [Nepenthes gracilis]|uniref:Serine/threonine-protein phosphatase 4 regulatory subunit 2 n=1 Tax=Nepenthes gracilis TaxID=150966 RepID=A0AAD3Y3Z6_NEPGR|nr:hypothetical protein Nepgr_027854 [Nepenthes gracilis]
MGRYFPFGNCLKYKTRRPAEAVFLWASAGGFCSLHPIVLQVQKGRETWQMEIPSNENSQLPDSTGNEGVPHDHEDLVPQLSDTNGGKESQHKFSIEEVRAELGVIALTGNFRQDWDELKSMLSFQLKQVLDEYPEAKMSDEQQNSSLGETYAELSKRLEEAFLSFLEGPPFTLQRICEILLDARGIYPNLSKLSLALEKNLLVTSTLTKCTDPYSKVIPLNVFEEGDEAAKPYSNSVENGGEHSTGDKDEIMTELEEAEVDDKTSDMEAFEDIAHSVDKNTEQTSNT